MKRFLMMMTLIGLVGNWNSTLTAQLVSPDSLYLNEDLPEINIVAVKPLIKAEADKTTYSIAEDPDSRTYTLLEMLRKVPLVTVDGEDNVKVNGQSSFKIYMNGRPSNMFSNNPKEVLRSIPASMIKKCGGDNRSRCPLRCGGCQRNLEYRDERSGVRGI